MGHTLTTPSTIKTRQSEIQAGFEQEGPFFLLPQNHVTQVESILRNLLPQQESKSAAGNPAASSSGKPAAEPGRPQGQTEEQKAGEDPTADKQQEEKFICNLQNSNTVSKGFDVSFKK